MNYKKPFLTVLDNYEPLKNKPLRFNDSPLMTKALQKAMMKRSRLKKHIRQKAILLQLGQI